VKMIVVIIIIIIKRNLYSTHYHQKVSKALHALCQYIANRNVLSEHFKESKESDSSVRYAGRLFRADGPVQENAVLPAVVSL